MILLLKKNKEINLNFIKLHLKNNLNILYFSSNLGIFKYYIIKNYFYAFNLKKILSNIWFELNSGWIGILFLNGLGFKATRKLHLEDKKYWRFNVGHSHVFRYFSPYKIIIKVKNRFVCIYGEKKNQIFDIANKIKIFHLPDVYKGVGIKFPNEIIKLKKGKMRQ